MSATPQCSHCGSFNLFTANYCSNCGTPLGTGSRSQNFAGSNPWNRTSYPQTIYGDPVLSQSLRRHSDIDHTKTGLLLLIIGTVLSPILYLNILGVILVLIGAVLTISGRKSFGDVHSRNTIVSVIIYIVGSLVISLGAVGYFFAGFSAASAANTSGVFNPALLSQSLGNAFQEFLIATAVGGAIIGLAQVLFTYALQLGTGKALLWLGYFSSIAIGILEIVTLLPLISTAESQTYTGGAYNPAAFTSLQSQLLLLGLVGFIPAVFYASALYLARSRIERQEIPELRPRQDSRLGSVFDDSRYFFGIFAKVMLPIMILGLFGLVMSMLHHY